MENPKDLTELHEPGHDLHLEHQDRTIRFLHRVIRAAAFAPSTELGAMAAGEDRRQKTEDRGRKRY